MKYLKIFETKILDDILDKISKDGEKNLTSWEREYLASFDTPKQKKMESELEDKPVYSGNEEEISSMTIDDIINSEEINDSDKEIEMYWEKLSDDEINDFFDRFSIRGDYATKTWEQLPKELKNVFIQYLIQMGYLKK